MSRSALVLCLLAAVCGAVHHSRLRGPTPLLDGRIVGGRPVDISQFPWQVSLEGYIDGIRRHICGGSIISSTWVLTAAHCFLFGISRQLYVRAGSSFRETGGTVYRVAKIIPHEDFSCFTGDYDFALLEISEPIAFGSNVQGRDSCLLVTLAKPCTTQANRLQTLARTTEVHTLVHIGGHMGICVRQAVILGSSEVDGGTKVNITGWGITGEGVPANQLQALTTSVVDRDTCSKAYAVLEKNVTERMICAGEEEGGKGVCHGDSGGPLVVGNTQYGVASWTYKCSLTGYPGVYSYVPAVRSWITEKTGV